METTLTAPAASAEPSLSDLRAMVATTAPVQEPKPATSEPTAEPKEPADAKTTQTATEPVETKPEPVTEEPAEELPEGVKKRIAKEVEKATRFQSEIDRVVSERKAKEAELAKLKGEPGSQPAKEPAKTPGKPKRPSFGEAGHETETWDQYEARGAVYEEAREKWIKDEAISEFQQKQTADQRNAKAKEAWDGAVKKHGAEFPAQMDTVVAGAPEGLQLAISSLENWDTVAVHLAKEPAKLKQLADQFTANPYAAVATLGRIEAALTANKQDPKPATSTEKPLPEPLAKVGGSASASGKDFQSTLETGSFSQFKASVNKARGIK